MQHNKNGMFTQDRNDIALEIEPEYQALNNCKIVFDEKKRVFNEKIKTFFEAKEKMNVENTRIEALKEIARKHLNTLLELQTINQNITREYYALKKNHKNLFYTVSENSRQSIAIEEDIIIPNENWLVKMKNIVSDKEFCQLAAVEPQREIILLALIPERKYCN